MPFAPVPWRHPLSITLQGPVLLDKTIKGIESLVPVGASRYNLLTAITFEKWTKVPRRISLEAHLSSDLL